MFLYVIVYLWKYTPVADNARNSCELFIEKCGGSVGKRGMAGLVAAERLDISCSGRSTFQLGQWHGIKASPWPDWRVDAMPVRHIACYEQPRLRLLLKYAQRQLPLRLPLLLQLPFESPLSAP
jgi:hypothetical protein